MQARRLYPSRRLYPFPVFSEKFARAGFPDYAEETAASRMKIGEKPKRGARIIRLLRICAQAGRENFARAAVKRAALDFHSFRPISASTKFPDRKALL